MYSYVSGTYISCKLGKRPDRGFLHCLISDGWFRQLTVAMRARISMADRGEVMPTVLAGWSLRAAGENCACLRCDHGLNTGWSAAGECIFKCYQKTSRCAAPVLSHLLVAENHTGHL